MGTPIAKVYDATEDYAEVRVNTWVPRVELYARDTSIADGDYAFLDFTPEQARELAAALVRAAEEVEAR